MEGTRSAQYLGPAPRVAFTLPSFYKGHNACPVVKLGEAHVFTQFCAGSTAQLPGIKKCHASFKNNKLFN